MIEIKNLTKVFKSKNKSVVVALNDINLTLPDSGLVFIIGKSGSGKSTLLNMLGGLDKATAGQVIADGNNISKFSNSKFYNYRSSYIGFIFQHYYLIDELTIKQNIQLALDIAPKRKGLNISELLKKVGLEGYENRYPSELSGGQQQRVAIARALIKNPSLILGDEPTGNLDITTSFQILKVLKEISKDRLVVIVSHNLDEADIYADRIIELSEGRIIKDIDRKTNSQYEFMLQGTIIKTDEENKLLSKKQKKFEVIDKTLYLPYYRDLTNNETSKMLELLKSGEVTNIIQQDNGFSPHVDQPMVSRKIKIPRSRLKIRHLFKYSKMFMKKRRKANLSTIFVTTLIFVVISIMTSFLSSNDHKLTYNKDNDIVVISKGTLKTVENTVYTAPLFDITNDDIQVLKDNGYDNEINLLYNDTISVSSDASKTNKKATTDLKRNLESFYIKETFGTLNCSLDYLLDLYGVDGKLNVLAGDIYTPSYGLIITDYVADSILQRRPTTYATYEDLIGSFPKHATVISNYISAVIDTNYEEKYEEIIKEYKDKTLNDDEISFIRNKLSKKPIYETFLKDALYNLGVTYNLSSNYKEDIKAPEKSNVAFARGLVFQSDSGKKVAYSRGSETCFTFTDATRYSSYKIKDGEMHMKMSTYNAIFDTDYTLTSISSFEPHKITIKYYDREIDGGKLLFEKTLLIKNLNSTGNLVNRADYQDLLDVCYGAFGMYLENSPTLENALKALDNGDFYEKTIDTENEIIIGKLTQVFVPFMKIILYGLYVFLLIYLVTFGVNNIKKNYYEIGIISALGAKNKDIGIIFISNVIITGLIICITSILLAPQIINFSDFILVRSFAEMLDLTIFNLSIVDSSALLLTKDLSIIVATTLISALIPMFILHRLKPIEIINSKE